MSLDRDRAWRHLCDWTETDSLRKHARAVELVMRAAAHRYGAGADDVEVWGIAGMLHDADYEKWPENHPDRIVAWLRDRGEEDLAHAISAHYSKWGVPYESQLDKALLACDELTGFIVACCLVRPEGVATLAPRSVKKKLKDKAFAAKVEHPLRVKAPSAASLVTQKIGTYRRDRSVRFVTAKRGDTFSHLAKRWCGKVDGVVQEIECLNETTTLLREGQQVGVPWVDDEVLLAILEAEAVPTMVASSGVAPAAAGGVPGPAGPNYATPAIASRLEGGVQPASGAAAPVGAASGFTLYKIKDGDTLWPILAKKFGNRKVPAMLKRVEELNPGINTDNLRPGKTIKLPRSAE